MFLAICFEHLHTPLALSVVEIAFCCVCVCVDDWYKAMLFGKLGESEGDVPPQKLKDFCISESPFVQFGEYFWIKFWS